MSDDTRPRLATWHVVSAMVALAVVLAVVAPQYGYHRDELYFRMLPPAWGYTDQPPLTPLLARAAIALLGDTVVAVRVVALVLAVASLPVLVLITREVGGGRLAQALTAWGMAGATVTLAFGHVLLTSSVDLVVWPGVLLLVIMAVRRDEGRWWLVAGALAGLSTVSKLLIVVLLVGIALGIALLGPRRWLRSGWLWGGVALCLVLALPALVYQVTNGWPQLTMGAGLSAENAAEVRVMMWPFLAILVGPVLAIVWIVALVALLRDPDWRPLRWLTVVLVVVVLFVLVAATQPTYTAGVLAVLTAVGTVPVARWARTRGRRIVVGSLLGVNAIGCVVTSLPVLPIDAFAASGLAAVNSASADQVGWPEYVAQIEEVAEASEADAIITSNYGEAGALDRFGADLPPVHSGHNALWSLGPPDDDAETVVVVGGQAESVAILFQSCEVAAELDHGLGVETEEQGEPIMVCEQPIGTWDELWPIFQHFS